MPLLALTGGIASGKSTVAARLAEHGAVVVDADRLVHDLQQPGTAVLAEIAACFGPELILSDGRLDRAGLGQRVFGDEEALARLNGIVHPAVKEESQRRFEEAFAADAEAIVVYDVPLLAEARGTAEWDLVVVAHAPAKVREQRLISERGMDAAAAQARIHSQADDDDRLALADVVIDTAGTLAETREQADALWERVRPAG